MEPIAVIGIGCRFPQAPNPETFWQLLRQGKDAIAPIPQDRWQVPAFYDPDPDTPGKMNVCHGGFLEKVDGFDAKFFRMSAEEVEHTDPQQRLFLEVAWEALENAGIAPASLAKTQTGVFTGLCTIDYHRLLYKNYDRLSSYSGTGTTMSITANRLSYLLDLQGPSMAIDAACSSSLVTVHLACQSLRSGESDLCLAGGVNLILSPDSTISSTKTRLLSVEGRCKSFDAEADGYARGEGCGVLVLKRLSEAIADNDNILALIKGSAVNHNGMSNSLSAPNGLAQQAVIRQALKNAGVEPAEVSYIDAHAVGTGIGDAIEFKALQAVYGTNRPPNFPCGVGSVKTNIGHLEAAAGISALIKVILSLQHEAIPPHLHLQQLNPYISLKDTFYIPTQLQSWQKNNRLAGVSAFGFGGTNAHVILAEAPKQPSQQEIRSLCSSYLVALSACDELALQQLVQKYQSFLAAQPQLDLRDLAFTANTGRNHFQHRLCLITESISQLKQQLTAFGDRHPTEGLLTGKVAGRKRPKIAWFFPGNSLNFEVTAALIRTQPAFSQATKRCEQILHRHLAQPLFPDSAARMQIPSVEKTQRDRCISFAVEYSLAQLWLAWGIKPKAVMGQGIGELVAATVAGIIELEDALSLVATRPLQSDEAARNSLLRAIDRRRPRIPLLSSRRDSVGQKIVTPEYWYDYWQQTEIVSTLLETPRRADWSPPPFRRNVETLQRLAQGNAPIDSRYNGGNPRTDKLHNDNALSRNPLAALSDYPLVLTMGMRTTVPANDTQYLFSYGVNFKTSWQEMMQSLGTLYVQGIEIDWSNFAERDCRPIPLPTYPFQRQRYWFAPAPETTVEPMPQLL